MNFYMVSVRIFGKISQNTSLTAAAGTLASVLPSLLIEIIIAGLEYFAALFCSCDGTFLSLSMTSSHVLVQSTEIFVRF